MDSGEGQVRVAPQRGMIPAATVSCENYTIVIETSQQRTIYVANKYNYKVTLILYTMETLYNYKYVYIMLWQIYNVAKVS